MPQDNDDKKKLLQESTTNSNTMKRNMSNPGLYNQLDQSQWMWTPPGATHKRFGKKRMTKKIHLLHRFLVWRSPTPSISERDSVLRG